MNGVDWLAKRIMAATDQAQRQNLRENEPRFNPRPAGVIRPDSASSTVLQYLTAHPGSYYRREQIVEATGRSERSVDWALVFLRSQGLIAAFQDGTRNPRYLRYSVVIKES